MGDSDPVRICRMQLVLGTTSFKPLNARKGLISTHFGTPLPRKKRPQIVTTGNRRLCLGVSAVATSPSSAPGKVDTRITPEVAKDVYYDMFLGREFEEMCAQMYYRGKMFGFVHLYSGQEAVSSGVIRCLRPDDYVCSTYRDHVHALSKGVPAKEVMAELFGKQTGICRGQGGSMHMFSSDHGFVSAPSAV